MCDVLKIPRSTYYKHLKQIDEKPKANPYTELVTEIFQKSRNTYGTRRIKHSIKQQTGDDVSRRRIGRIMKTCGLVSVYQVKSYKVHTKSVNEEKVENKLSRAFDNRDCLEVCVNDLTYVKVKNTWNYVCFVLDLHNREIIGYSAGEYKSASPFCQAFSNINHNLNDIKIFHTDRGSEFKNEAIDGLLTTFGIERSLSKKGCPYDNAVAEATYKTFKTEFVSQHTFDGLDTLKLELSDYVNWYNNFRLHSSLGYHSPTEYKRIQASNKALERQNETMFM